MASILERLHIPFGLRLWDMSDGDKYTIDDDSTILTPELAASDKATDEAYNKRFRQEPKKGNGGKGKEPNLKENIKVKKEQLNKAQVQTSKKEKISEQKEIVDD